MKKTYMIPTLIVVKIQTMELMAGSVFDRGSFGTESGSAAGAGVTTADGRYDDFDWEDEE